MGSKTTQGQSAPEARHSDAHGARTVPGSPRDPIRIGLHRSCVLGLISSFVLVPVDAFVVSSGDYAVTVAWPATIRILIAVSCVAFMVLLRVYGTSYRRLWTIELVGYTCVATLVGLLAMKIGGLSGTYSMSVAILLIARAGLVATHWQRAALTSLSCVLSQVAVMALAAIWDQRVTDQWTSRPEVGLFIGTTLLLGFGGAIGSYASHAVWLARRQVQEARKLGGFRLKARIGSGGMGEVWLAWDGNLRRDVALKILTTAGNHRTDLVARFRREARALCRLRSPYAVHVYEFGASDDGVFYIAMELLVGEDLETYVLGRGPLHPRDVALYGRQAARALADAHAHHLIHRDVKPANLFLARGEDGANSVKLIDFGLAKVTEPDATAVTMAGWVGGTPQFMAPEQCRGAPADERSDIYSLGATMHFLATGRPPFDAPNPRALMLAHLEQAPAPLPDLPEPLAQIVGRCLRKDPRDRFQTAGGLELALSTWLRERRSPGRTRPPVRDSPREARLPLVLDAPKHDDDAPLPAPERACAGSTGRPNPDSDA